jgi:hypothetical protein
MGESCFCLARPAAHAFACQQSGMCCASILPLGARHNTCAVRACGRALLHSWPGMGGFFSRAMRVGSPWGIGTISASHVGGLGSGPIGPIGGPELARPQCICTYYDLVYNCRHGSTWRGLWKSPAQCAAARGHSRIRAAWPRRGVWEKRPGPQRAPGVGSHLH